MIVLYYEASLNAHGISFSSETTRENGIIAMFHYRLASLVHSETDAGKQMTDEMWDGVVEKIKEMVDGGRLIVYPIRMPSVKARNRTKEIIIVANIISSFSSACGGTNRKWGISECRGCKMETKGPEQTLCPSCESTNYLSRPVVTSIERNQLAGIVEGSIVAETCGKFKYILQLVDYKFCNKSEEQGAMLNYADSLARDDIMEREEA